MPDRFHPSTVARAYREEFPGKFDDISDKALLDTLAELDPDTYRLVDPLLIGAEVLSQAERERRPAPLPALRTGAPYDPAKGPYPLPTPPPAPTGLDIGVTTATRVVPAVAGAIGGGLLGGPPGMYAGGAGGAGVGETAAQAYEKRLGLREEFSLPTIAFETALGAVNPAARATTTLGRVGTQAGYGALLGGGGQVGRSVIETGELPTFETAALATVIGTVGAATLQGAAEKLSTLYRNRRPSVAPDYPTLQQAKSYLEEIAAAKVSMETVGGVRGAVESALELGPPPLPPPPVGLLPPGRGDPNAIRGYPPGVNPEIELVGSMAPPAARVIGGRDVGAVQPPPSFEQALESSLQAEPGPPRLVRPLVLSSQEGGPPSVPRGMDELLPPARPSMAAPIRQTGVIGGAPPSLGQPRLPRVLEPGVDRPYATGPNAGPRRPPREEVHGTPRKAIRYVQTGRTSTREVYPSKLRAEDPGTYPPEVRRELAAMAWELEQYPHERVQGGITRAQIADMMESANVDVSTAIGLLKARGATAGGAIAGAPVYHDVIEAAKGSFPHVTRAKMLTHLRAALLEGKGTGLTDAAAQVARARLAERASAGGGRLAQTTRIRAARGDEGDPLIGWVDETGAQALPEQDLDPFTRAVREAETGELLAAYRLRQTGDVPENLRPFYDAAATELVHRGAITPEQLDLPMAGRQVEGGPPARPEPPAGPEQPVLPGAEGVRTQEIPTPPVAEAPFALAPPPGPPPIAPRTGNLLRDLGREEGILVFDIPAGDRTGLRRWLKAQEKEHDGETWFNRAEQAVDEGDWDRAFQTAAAASARSYAKAYAAASTPAKRAAIEAGVRGTPLQEDLPTQIITGARQRAGVGTAPPARNFPPSPRVTQAGAARGRARIGPAGIINPGPPQRPLSTTAPALRAGTLDRAVVRLLMEGIESPEGLATVPGNTDTYLRLFRQVGEKIYRGQNLKLLREAGMDIPPEALAQHWNATISDAGRTLNLLSQFAQTHAEALGEAASRMDIGGALGRPGRYVGARGQIAPPPVQAATQEVLEQVAKDTSAYHANALANDLQKRTEVGPLRAIHDASYAFMLSKWATAVRNYVSFTGRYGVDSLDHALTIPIARLLGDEPTAQLSSALLRERGLTPFRRGTAVVPWKGGWAEDIQGIFDFSIDRLNEFPHTDARHSIRLLLDLPEQAAHFLGRATGEDLSTGYANVPVMRYLTDPAVQRFLTMFNRGQEFSARGTVFDATNRALIRAKGLDPNEVLFKNGQPRPTPEIVEMVGGQAAFDNMIFTSTAQSLEATFAGRTSKDSLPGALIRFLNDAWPLKLGIPFPRFNLSSAPRFLWDHSPAALLDLVRFPLDRAGLTAPKGTVAGGRLYRGVRAQEILQTDLPALQGRIGQAERAQGEALAELLGTQREWNVRQRQITRLEKRTQPSLPETQSALEEARAFQGQLARRRDTLKGTVQEQTQIVRGMKGQQKELLDRVADATGINAPNYAQFLARMGVGTVGMLGAAWVVRAQEGAQGTRWYEFRVDRGADQDPIILDFRPFAPFAQYLFVADVLQDFTAHTDWGAAKAQAGEEGYGPGGALAWSRAVWENYEGKYTEAELGSQFAQAFLSISRAAGTTLTLTDLLTQNGWPSLEDAARATVGTIGQFLSRFTIPGQQVSDIAISPFSEEEAKIRTPPKATLEDWERPLAGPLANVPFARQLIPERTSQTTGQPVAAEYPLLRGLLGIGTTPRDFITEEVRRVGVSGQSVYIRETGDVGLDRLVAETYARNLQGFLPEVLESEEYAQLGTPATQRDYLQRYIFPAIKRASLAETRELLGEERYGEAMVRGEESRRRERQQRLLERLEGETPGVPPEAEPAPDVTAVPPPPPPPSAF